MNCESVFVTYWIAGHPLLTDTDGNGINDADEDLDGDGITNKDKIMYGTDFASADTDGNGVSEAWRRNMDYCSSGQGEEKKCLDIAFKHYVQCDFTDDSPKLKERINRLYAYGGICGNGGLWVAQLDSGFDGVDYLKIQQTNGILVNGGNQSWWRDKAISQEEKNYVDYVLDTNYRLWKGGCGVIAMSDAEIYLSQHNKVDDIVSSTDFYDTDTGIIKEGTYRDYVMSRFLSTYFISDDFISYKTGLRGHQLQQGMRKYLSTHQIGYNHAQWAPHSIYGKNRQKELILKDIQEMLEKNIPVVFNYFSMNKEKKIMMRKSLEDAIQRTKAEGEQSVGAHYMTIIGLYKYMNETTAKDEYILKVVSWGDIFYIRYDEYAENLNYFSSILKIY